MKQALKKPLTHTTGTKKLLATLWINALSISISKETARISLGLFSWTEAINCGSWLPHCGSRWIIPVLLPTLKNTGNPFDSHGLKAPKSVQAGGGSEQRWNSRQQQRKLQLRRHYCTHSYKCEQKPSEVLPLCIAAQDGEAFLPRNAPFAETLMLFLEESNTDLYWLYAYNATPLISDQYIREAWQQYSGS